MDDGLDIEVSRGTHPEIYPVVITKYEFATLIRLRAQQLDTGMDPLIPEEECEGIYDNTIIAEMEIRRGLCPIEIIRPYKGKTRRIRVTGNEIIQYH